VTSNRSQGAFGFDASLNWKLSPEVAIRPEQFGALAYHYGNRRLVFLKSKDLVQLVHDLSDFDSAEAAIAATIAPTKQQSYVAALARLAQSEVLVVS
jgi:putative mycofactocin binding protein MftB